MGLFKKLAQLALVGPYLNPPPPAPSNHAKIVPPLPPNHNPKSHVCPASPPSPIRPPTSLPSIPRQVFMNGMLGDPVCSDVVHEGNYAATLKIEVAIAESSMSEDDMARWLILNGPLSVALDAIGMDYYSSGIDMGEVCILETLLRPLFFFCVSSTLFCSGFCTQDIM